MRAFHSPSVLGLLLIALGCSIGWAAPGAINLSVSNPTPAACDTFTVTASISGYTDTTEADGYNFRILYDPARFAVVRNAASLHDTAGPTQNWLRYPAQENVDGSVLSDFTQYDPGVIHLSVVDLRLAPDPLNPRGTAATAGFLYEITFTALTHGAGAITVAPAVDGGGLHDAFLNPGGVPSLAGATVNITVTGVRLQIQRTDLNQVTIAWPKGVLETTDTLGTLWTPLPAATNSLTVPATDRRFYRAVIP